MKKAFTMLELIAVILVVAILSIVLIPRFSDSKLREAADQIISHIRYTQHLAMIEEKYIPDPSLSDEDGAVEKSKNARYWYKSFWEIHFHTSGTHAPTYSVYSDSATATAGNAAYDGNPKNADLIAVNPQNKLRMCGLASSTSSIPDSEIDTSLRLGKKFGLTSLTVTNNCGTNRFLFDSFGRPYCNTPTSSETTKYFFDSDDRLTSTAQIRLCIDTDCRTISIEPETGYVHMD